MPSIRALTLGLLAVALVGCSESSARTGAPSAAAMTGSTPVRTEPVAPRVTESPRASSSPGPAPSEDPAAADLPSRIVIEALGVDLPVVSGDTEVRGNPRDYPLCDVAQFLTTYRYPGRPGTTTWIYAHARTGMFLPLLEASRRAEGGELAGTAVDVYSTGGRRYRYRITGVHPHATDRTLAADVPPTEGRLVLQTSEGPSGTVPKLQVSGVLVEVTPADPGDATPSAAPRACYD